MINMKEFQKITLSQTNCFLLKASGGYLLVDCGSARDEGAFLSKLGGIGLTPMDIRYLLLTHHHSDHCGLLPFLLSVNPGLKLIMSAKCADYLETGRHFHPDTELYASKALDFAIRLYNLAGGNITENFPPYFRQGNEVILATRTGVLPDITGVSGMLLCTPGHTPDSISLIVDEDAFVGDAARNMLKVCGSAYEPVLYYDRSACYESWKRLLSMGVKHVHPAHGRSFPARLLKKQLNHPSG